VITATQAPEKYLEIFDQLKSRMAQEPRWLQSLRQEAFTRFAETGFPNTHDEDWRFTNVAAVAGTSFELAGLESIKKEQLVYESIAPTAVRVRVYDGLALVTGREDMRVRNSAGLSAFSVRFTEVYVRRDGRWLLTAWQTKPLVPVRRS